MNKKLIASDNIKLFLKNEIKEIDLLLRHLRYAYKLFERTHKHCNKWLAKAERSALISKNKTGMSFLLTTKVCCENLLEVFQAFQSIENGAKQLLEVMVNNPVLIKCLEHGGSAKTLKLDTTRLSLNENLILVLNDFCGGFYNNKLASFLGYLELSKGFLEQLNNDNKDQQVKELIADINLYESEITLFMTGKEILKDKLMTYVNNLAEQYEPKK